MRRHRLRSVIVRSLRAVADRMDLRLVPIVHRSTDTIYSDISPSCQVDNLEMLYEAFLGRLSAGTFVEVGAFDGLSFSNTSCLATLGWHGMYVEPVPEFAKKCAQRNAANPNVIVREFALGAEEGEVDLIVGGPLSTTKQQLRDDYESIRWGTRSFDSGHRLRVRKTTLDRLLEDEGFQPGFELLVIDVEGSEIEVFAGFTLERWRPKMMIIEITDLHPTLRRAGKDYWELYQRLLHEDYVCVYKDSMNTVLIDTRQIGYRLD